MISDIETDICIVGMGPAGIGAALSFARSGKSLQVVCIEAGDSVWARQCRLMKNANCDKEYPCSVISGIGGASLFGGHKFSMLPAGTGLVDIVGSYEVVQSKLSDSLRTIQDYVPLLRPDLSVTQISAARQFYEKRGFSFRYYDSYVCQNQGLRDGYERMISNLNAAGIRTLPNAAVVAADRLSDRAISLTIRSSDSEFHVSAQNVIVAVGRSGEMFLRSLNKKLNLAGRENHLEIGVRLEFPTKIFPDIDKGHMDLKLLYENYRTFCVCKGGGIISYQKDGLPGLDGYYDSSGETSYTNLAVAARLNPDEENHRLLTNIRKRVSSISNGKPVRQGLAAYLGVRSTSLPIKTNGSPGIGYEDGDVNQCFPHRIAEMVQKGVHKFASAFLPEANWQEVDVLAPSIEYSWLQFPVDHNFAVSPGIYLVGDCTGRFRGLLQAFCSGAICAEAIINNARD